MSRNFDKYMFMFVLVTGNSFVYLQWKFGIYVQFQYLKLVSVPLAFSTPSYLSSVGFVLCPFSLLAFTLVVRLYMLVLMMENEK